jgi:hypothetical protein
MECLSATGYYHTDTKLVDLALHVRLRSVSESRILVSQSWHAIRIDPVDQVVTVIPMASTGIEPDTWKQAVEVGRDGKEFYWFISNWAGMPAWRPTVRAKLWYHADGVKSNVVPIDIRMK